MSQGHLKLFERMKIEFFLHQNMKQSEIAAHLGRDPSVISRELSRNAKPYCAQAAQRHYTQERTYCRRSKVLDHPPLRSYVYDKLTQDWSPEQIAGRLKLDYPHDGRMWVAIETIYQRIYTDPKWNRAFGQCLRQGRKTRQKRGGLYQRRGPIVNRISIEQRPEEVDTLESYGHWEGDTIIGSNQQGAVVTLNERKGDWIRAIPVRSRKADGVAQAIIEALSDIPAHLRKTITFDNGSEFAHHQKIAQALGVDIYFAHPYSSNERARNENMNGLLRQYLPKKTSFEGLTSEEVNRYVNALNDRPRKKQNYRTPNEVFEERLRAFEY